MGELILVGLGLAIGLFVLGMLGILGALAALAIHLSWLLVLVLDVLAIVEIVKSRADGMKKAVWILMIFFLPVLGLALWYFFGREKRRR